MSDAYPFIIPAPSATFPVKVWKGDNLTLPADLKSIQFSALRLKQSQKQRSHLGKVAHFTSGLEAHEFFIAIPSPAKQ